AADDRRESHRAACWVSLLVTRLTESTKHTSFWTRRHAPVLLHCRRLALYDEVMCGGKWACDGCLLSTEHNVVETDAHPGRTVNREQDACLFVRLHGKCVDLRHRRSAHRHALLDEGVVRLERLAHLRGQRRRRRPGV